jgi:hypothetical protein
MAYSLFFIILLVLAFIEAKASELQQRYLLWLSRTLAFIFIVVFVGFRYKVGTDWQIYMGFYEIKEDIFSLFSGQPLISFSEQWERIDTGFKLVAMFFKTLGINFFFFQLILTTFFYFSFFRLCIFLNIRYIVLAIALVLGFTLFRDFDVLRQNLALGIIMLVIPLIVQRRLFLFLLGVALASFIHSSALFVLPLYMFCRLKKVTRTFLLVTLCMFGLSFFFAIPVISTALNALAGITDNLLFGKVSSLLKGAGFSIRFGLTTTLPFLCVFVLFYFSLDVINKDRRLITLLILSITFMLTFILFAEVEEMASRVSYYFLPAIIFLFVRLFQEYRIKTKAMLLPSLCVFIFFRLYIFQLKPAQKIAYYPYYNYLTVDSDDEVMIIKKTTKMNDQIVEYYENILEMSKENE